MISYTLTSINVQEVLEWVYVSWLCNVNPSRNLARKHSWRSAHCPEKIVWEWGSNSFIFIRMSRPGIRVGLLVPEFFQELLDPSPGPVLWFFTNLVGYKCSVCCSSHEFCRKGTVFPSNTLTLTNRKAIFITYVGIYGAVVVVGAGVVVVSWITWITSSDKALGSKFSWPTKHEKYVMHEFFIE